MISKRFSNLFVTIASLCSSTGNTNMASNINNFTYFGIPRSKERPLNEEKLKLLGSGLIFCLSYKFSQALSCVVGKTLDVSVGCMILSQLVLSNYE